jgi:hypothetical protein
MKALTARTPARTPDEIAAQLALFIAPDQVTELRALHVGERGRTFSGWFDGKRLRDLARHALALSRQAAGVYFIPNPVDPDLGLKRLNTALNVPRGFSLTHDAEVLERRYLIVDLDPRRLWLEIGLDESRVTPTQDAPTSGRELAFARRIADRHVRPFLADLGFPPPVVMLSGNGVHLVYRMTPLPGGHCGNRDPAAQILHLLDERFSCYGVKIDPNTYNPCRMLKVPGTAVRRGEASASRPYRTARILEVPDDWQPPGPAPRRLADEPTGAASGAVAPRVVASPRPGQPGVERPAAKRPRTKPVEPTALFDARRDGNAGH